MATKRVEFAVAILFFIPAWVGCTAPEPESPIVQETPPPGLLIKTSSSHREESVESTPSVDSIVPPQTVAPRTARIAPSLPPILSVRTKDHIFYGLPIGLFSNKTFLMLRDGAIHEIAPETVLQQQIENEGFRAIDVRELTPQIQSEFGNSYRIRYSAPYLVVARPDRIQKWSDRFRSFQSSLELYCVQRNIALRRPDFPLIAIVFGTHKEFLSYAKLERAELPANCLGYYSQKTNRIVLFENGPQDESIDTLETICHEATHQLAFNTGLHQRMSETPLWVCEGFAVMFEAPSYSNLATRDHSSTLPESQWSNWRRLSRDPVRVRQLLEQMIRSDDSFKSDTLDSYCIAWAASHYLSNRRSRDYAKFLQRIGNLDPFVDYTAGDRMRDFYSSFGNDLGILTRNIIQHFDTIK